MPSRPLPAPPPRAPHLRPWLQHNVRDWLRVIASNKDRSVDELRYFNIADQNEDDDEDDEE